MSNRLKLKVRTKIPAALLGGIGTVVTKDGLTYKVELDYSTLQDSGTLFDPNYVVVAIWNPHTDEWARVSLTDFITGSFGTGTSGYFLQANGPGIPSTYAGFLQSGTGALTRTWQDKGRDFVNVMDFGAVGNGTTDDTAAIQNAINSLPASGGTVYFPPKTFKITSSIVIGNGSSSTVSTKKGVILQGATMPSYNPGISGYPAPTGTKLVMSNAVTSTYMIILAGPLQGWGLKNLFLDGSNDTNFGIEVLSASYGVASDISIDNVLHGIVSSAYPLGGFTGVSNVDSLSNTWDNITIRIAGTAGAKGVFLTGASDGSSNTDFNTLSNINVGAKANTSNYGYYLAVCDSNVFNNCGCGGVTTGLAFDYTANSSFPNSNRFFAYDYASYANLGTPGAGAQRNVFYGLTLANSHPAPALANTYTEVLIDNNSVLSVPSPTVSGITAASTVGPRLRLDSFYGDTASIPTIDYTINRNDGLTTHVVGRVGAQVNADGSGDLILYGNVNSATPTTPAESLRIVGVTGSVISKHPTGGIGYGVGAGGTVTQATSKGTSVTLNRPTGQIVVNGASLAAGAVASFIFTNSCIAPNDVLVLNHTSVGTVGGYTLNGRCASGQAGIDIRNNTAGALAEAIVLQYALIKSATS